VLADNITADDFSLSSLDNFYDDSPIIKEGFGINAIRLDRHTLCNSSDVLPNLDPDYPDLLSSSPSSTPIHDYLNQLEDTAYSSSDAAGLLQQTSWIHLSLLPTRPYVSMDHELTLTMELKHPLPMMLPASICTVVLLLTARVALL
jgi:hypothetical protein